MHQPKTLKTDWYPPCLQPYLGPRTQPKMRCLISKVFLAGRPLPRTPLGALAPSRPPRTDSTPPDPEPTSWRAAEVLTLQVEQRAPAPAASRSRLWLPVAGALTRHHSLSFALFAGVSLSISAVRHPHRKRPAEPVNCDAASYRSTPRHRGRPALGARVLLRACDGEPFQAP